MSKYLLIILIFLVSCSSQSIKIVKEKAKSTSDDKARNVEENEILKDYHSLCKVKIKLNEDNKSGNCEIALSKSNQLYFETLDPIGRSLIKVYMDEYFISVVNHYEETFLDLVNNSENRTRVFGMDLTLDDLRLMLFSDEDSIKKLVSPKYTFITKADKPVIITKFDSGQKINIFFKDWMEYESVEYPKKIIINETVNDSKIFLLILKITIGKIQNLNKLTLPDGYKTI